MTIDHQLIEKSKSHSEQAFRNKESTHCPHLFFLNNFLNTEILAKVCNFISRPELPWQTVELQQYRNRQSISWIPDSVVEELYYTFANLTVAIEETVSRKQVFDGINIWKDQFPYTIKKHSDQNSIGSSLQIYLNHCDIDLTTHFSYNEKILKPNNISNSGYFLDNNGKVMHWLENTVPENFARFSIYAIWRNK